VIALGNGANDAEMLEAATLGIAVPGDEGLAVVSPVAADVVKASIRDALDLLRDTDQLVATLRR
jgi:soluble P-type ATPase